MRTYHRVIFGDSREMRKVDAQSVHLVVTSPPYWQLKDYECEGQIGFDDSYKQYIENLNLVWEECYRVLHPGCRLCVNIGDQFARAVYYGRYKVIPIRTEIIKFCESIGFDYMGAIIWQKVTTCNTSGGASVMGSFPYPRNGILKLDYEFILIFKKLGKAPQPDQKTKDESKLTTEEWNEYFSGHWNFPGVKQDNHLAKFPLELPKRLIRMFTFKGERVLDPFLGSGTTTEAAMRLERNSDGYEINRDFESVIKERISAVTNLLSTPDFNISFQPSHQPDTRKLNDRKSAWPLPVNVPELELKTDPRDIRFKSKITIDQESSDAQHKVAEIIDCDRILLDTGQEIRLLGVSIPKAVLSREDFRNDVLDFLGETLIGKKVILRFDTVTNINNTLAAYILLPNKTHVNAKLIKAGYAVADDSIEYKFKKRFQQYTTGARDAGVGFWREI